MFGRKDREAKERILRNMPAKNLRRYCDRHQHDLLSFDIMNTRFEQALFIMRQDAEDLSEKSRTDLAIYTKILLIDEKAIKQPRSLQEIYAPLLGHNSFQKRKLEFALQEFSAFVRSPVERFAKLKLRRFILSLSPTTISQQELDRGRFSKTESPAEKIWVVPAQDFEKDLVRYKPQTTYLPHPSLTYSD